MTQGAGDAPDEAEAVASGLTGWPHGMQAELRAMVKLALPIVGVQVGQMTMGVVDTMMVGRVSATALAGIALGNIYFFAAVVFGMGVLMALDPVVAQAVGADEPAAVTRGVQRGLVLALGMSVLASLLLLPAGPVFALLGQPPGVSAIGASYARISIIGIVPFYAFSALRQTLQALKRVRAVLWATLLANVVNAVFNYAFIFGKLGSPAMGAVGTAWATAFSRWLMLAFLMLGAHAALRARVLPLRREALDWAPLRRMIAIGAPIGIQMQLEYGVFAVVGVMMGWMGAEQLAGHQIALNIASLTFMVPLGVSSAVAVLVGHAIGRGDTLEARRAALAGLICGVGFMMMSAIVMLAFPELLTRAYSGDVAVIAIGTSLIPIAGVFQVFDGIQVVSIGILRGAGDTRTPMLVNILGYWLIGLPTSAFVGFTLGGGPRGLWWGLTLGLALVAVILLWRVGRKLSAHVGRIEG